MIKASELRIGNITNTGIVTSIHKDYVGMDCYVRLDDGTKMGDESSGVDETFIEDELGFDEFGGEPLTEEWLTKFGFEKTKDYGQNDEDLFDLPHFGGFYMNKDGTLKPKPYYFADAFCDSLVIRHVHQLQNLYFALTGEELEIKK